MSKAAQIAAMRDVYAAFGVDPDSMDDSQKRVVWDAMVRVFRACDWRPPAEKADGTAPRRQEAGGLPTTLPPYGRQAGQSIAAASKDDCRFYERGCLRTLDDASKERFHAKERLMLEAIRARLRALGEAGDWE